MKSLPIVVGVAALLVSPLARAQPVTGWVIGQNNAGGNLSLTSAGTAAPVWGDDSPDNADATSIYAPVPEVALAADGESLTLSGSAVLSGVSASGAQFRWGLFHTNGSPDTNGWLGYFAGNGNTSAGGNLQERNAGNTTFYYNSTGTTVLTTSAAPNQPFTDGTYALSLVIVRDPAGLRILTSLVRDSDGATFTSHDFLDASPQTLAFDRVALLAGGALNADQIRLSGMDLTKGSLPSVSLGARLFGIDFNRSDTPGAPSQGLCRVIAGSTTQSANPASLTKAVGTISVTVSEPGATALEFRGANGDGSRAIPGGDISRSFMVADFVATRAGQLDLTIGGLPAGEYACRSYHLDPFTAGALGFAQGASPTTPQTLESRFDGTPVASVQPTALGSAGLNTTFIGDSQVPTLITPFESDGISPAVLSFVGTLASGADRFVLLNGFEIFEAAPAP